MNRPPPFPSPSALRPGRCRPILVLALLASTGWGCADVTDPGPPVEARGVVLNSLEVSLTVFPVDDPTQTRTIGLGPEGSPVSLAVSGRRAVVPLGFVPVLAVVDLDLGEVVERVPLPSGSGATGVAFRTDSTVLVANPTLNTVSPVDLAAGTAGPEIAVGGYPQVVVRVGERMAVVNAELGPDFLPLGPGTVTVLDRASLAVLGEVELSGENPGSAAVGPDGRLYVVNSGHFGAGDGSLSVVDLVTLREVEHHEGFGEFPFSAAFPPGDDVLHVGSFGFGLALFDTGADVFVRSPAQAVTPEGVASVSGHAFDAEGRLYTLRPECGEASVANRLTPSFEVDVAIPVGVCPIAIAFAESGG